MSAAPNSVTPVEREGPLSPTRQDLGAHERQAIPSQVEQPFYSIADLARRWRLSRASVYNILRGEKVLDFARPGRRGHKLVALETVRRIEGRRMKVLR